MRRDLCRIMYTYLTGEEKETKHQEENVFHLTRCINETLERRISNHIGYPIADLKRRNDTRR